jgi:hypothetical protein
MGAQMWADDLIVATSHADWETAKEYMEVLMRSTKEWADTHGQTRTGCVSATISRKSW